MSADTVPVVTQPDDDEGATSGRADEDGVASDDLNYEPPDDGESAYRSRLDITWDEPPSE